MDWPWDRGPTADHFPKDLVGHLHLNMVPDTLYTALVSSALALTPVCLVTPMKLRVGHDHRAREYQWSDRRCQDPEDDRSDPHATTVLLGLKHDRPESPQHEKQRPEEPE